MSKKKVITVNGDSTNWYDKVIFVVKKDKIEDYNDIDFVLEAENIISNYMLNSNMQMGKQYTREHYTRENNTRILKKHDGIDIFLYSSICLCLVVLSVLIVQSI